jgi:hypothetical protein
MSRFLLVELEPDLAERMTTQIGVWNSLKLVNGVRSITDLALISQPTLDAIMLKPTALLRRDEPTAYNAIRHYWKRKQQPRLPE